MNLSSRRTSRSLGVLLTVSLFLAACGGGGDDRSRNVESLAGTACTKKGATKTVSKLNYVCGVGAKGNVWFAVVGKLTTKGGKACKPLGKFEAAKTRVCGSVKKKNIWVKVAPLPVAVSGVGETTIPAPESTVVLSESSSGSVDTSVASAAPEASPTTTPPATENAVGELNEVARALAPAPQPTTVEEFVELLVPRPVEAQAVRRVPTSIKVEGGAPTIANGSGFAAPLSVTVLDQNDEPLAAEGNTIVATISRPDATLTGAVVTTDSKGSATFTNLRVNGVAGPAVVTVTADFGASVEIPVEVTPGPAVKLSVQNHPTQIIVSEKFATDPTVALLDKDGNQVRAAGVEVLAKEEKSSLAVVKTDGAGVAVFAGLKIDAELARPEGYKSKIVYSVPSDPSIASEAVDVTLGPGSPKQIKIVTQPSQVARAGVPLETQPIVRVVDANGNPVAMKGVSVSGRFVCDYVVSNCWNSNNEVLETVTTDDAGIARFANLALRDRVGFYVVQFQAFERESGFFASRASSPVNLRAGSAASIVVGRSTTVFTYGTSVDSAFDLSVVDAFGNLVPDFNEILEVATLKSVDFAFPTPVRFAKGRLTLQNVTVKGSAGTIGYTFRAGGLASSGQSLTLIAGAPARMEILNRPGTISSDTTLTTPLAVQILDEGGNTVNVPNLQVRLSASDPNPSTENATTTERGIAAFVITKFPKAGVTTVRYEGTLGLSSVPSVSDNITVVAGVAKSVKLLTTNSTSGRSGLPVASQPKLQLIDTAGNDVYQAQVEVKARVNLTCFGHNSQLSNGTALSDDSGRVTFDSFTITGKACGYVVRFIPTGGVGAGDLSVTLRGGVPAALDIVTQPSGAVNGKALTTQPVIQIVDSAGNPVQEPGVTVSSTLDGTPFNAQTDSSGRATFVGVTASGVAGNRQVLFTGTGLKSVKSSLFLMAPGDVARLVPEVTSIDIGQAGSIPSVVLQDVSGNKISSTPSVALTLTSSSGTSWILGSSAAISSDGTAQFPNTKISSTATTASLRYSISGRSMSTTVTVNFTQGPAAGQVGPSGGVIFAAPVPNADIAAQAYSANYFGVPIEVTKGGRFGEVAPADWEGSTGDPKYKWSDIAYAPDGMAESGGYSGFTTAQILNGIGRLSMDQHTSLSAAEAAASLDKFGFNNWLLPVSAELGLIIDGVKSGKLNNVGLVPGGKYWTSSALVASPIVRWLSVNPAEGFSTMPRTSMNYVRPIRYFN